MPDTRLESCSFVRKGKFADMARVQMIVPTGSRARSQALRDVCVVFAAERGCTFWAMPDLLSPVGSWLVFRVTGTRYAPTFKFVTKTPSREAAEMWMMHRD